MSSFSRYELNQRCQCVSSHAESGKILGEVDRLIQLMRANAHAWFHDLAGWMGCSMRLSSLFSASNKCVDNVAANSDLPRCSTRVEEQPWSSSPRIDDIKNDSSASAGGL